MNKTVTRILLSIIILIVGSVLYELFVNIDKGIIRIWDLQEFLRWTARGLPSLLVVLLIGHFPIYFKKPFWGIGISFAIAFLLYMGVREADQDIGLSANIGTLLTQGGIPSLLILLWSGKIGRL